MPEPFNPRGITLPIYYYYYITYITIYADLG